MRGADFPIHKNRGIRNRFAEMSTSLDVDFKRRGKLLLDPSEGVVERGVWLRGIRCGPSLGPCGGNVGHVLLVDLLRGIQQESRGKSEKGKKHQLRHVWPRVYLVKMQSDCGRVRFKTKILEEVSDFFRSGERYMSTG
jgi:hypothetical protein